jgi:PAP2 superfamily
MRTPGQDDICLAKGICGLQIEQDDFSEEDARTVPGRTYALVAMMSLVGIAVLMAGALFGLADVGNGRISPVLAAFMMLSLWAGLIINGITHIVWFARPNRRRLDLRAGWIMTAILIAGLTLPTFEIFKQAILPARGFPLDPTLAAIDRALFFGHDPWTITHAVFGSLGATLFFDKLYAIWLPLMFVFPAVAVMGVSDLRLRTRMLACWLASWLLIAGIGAWIFGSAGPCYYTALIGPDPGFAAFDQRLAALAAAAHAKGQVIAAVDFQQMLLRQMKAGGVDAVGGISAMPSMHVAMASLFAMAGFARVRWLGILMTAYAIGIWIGSIHLGWHYAIDGIVGAAMMALLWWATGHVVGLSGKRALSKRASEKRTGA